MLARRARGWRRSRRMLGLGRPPQRLDRRRGVGLPSVSVPVLSTTSVSTCSQVARSPRRCLNRTPACAPRPSPTMIDIGVASPSAQGQAMISTATAADQRVGEARLGAPDRPGDEGGRRATAITGGHELAGHHVGEALDRRAAALRLGHHLRRCAPAGCRADPARPRMTKLPVAFTVPPITGAPGCFATGIGSPVTIDSSTDARALEHHAVDRHLLAGPHAQPVADLRPGRAARRPRCRRRRCAARSRRQAQQGLGWRPPVASRARSSSTWPSSTSTTITAAASK